MDTLPYESLQTREMEQPGNSASQTSAGQQPELSLLERLVNQGSANSNDHTEIDRWKKACNAGDPLEMLRIWANVSVGEIVDCGRLRRRLASDIARIDQLLSAQVNEVLHAPAFQALESAWRGLHYLWSVRRRLLAGRGLEETGPEVIIRVLDVSKRELKKNFEAAAEFDQSELFKKVYEEEFGTAGGEPYGTLIANYEFSNHPEDIDLLGKLSEVGAAAFAPVITGAAPSLLGMDDFSTMEQTLDLHAVFQQPKHLKWRALRGRLDSQFLGMTVPRVLMRAPYDGTNPGQNGFRFVEVVDVPDRRNYLWGSAAWPMGAVLLRAFISSGWFADIRGADRSGESGGMVSHLPSCEFKTDSRGVGIRSSVEVAISDNLEGELCTLGFIPLSHCKDTDYSVFYSNSSVHLPEVFSDPAVTANARISAMLQYVLCCSRIAHYIKIHVRQKIGAAVRPEKIQADIMSWIVDYVTADDRASPEMKARYPLREAEVTVTDIPGSPGEYSMTLRLLPHYQLDQLTSTMTLKARRVEFKQ